MTDYVVNEDLLIGTTSFKGLTGIAFELDDPQVDPWAGLFVEGVTRYNPVIIPGMPGEVPDGGPVLDAYDFTIGPFLVRGEDRADFLSNLMAARAVFAAVNFVGTRRLTAALTPFYVDDSANLRYAGMPIVSTISPVEAVAQLQLRNLDGEWT